MELYFSPLACSMATRIALYEAGLSAQFSYVDLKRKRVENGTDFYAVNPLGLVPVLRTDAGEVLTENPAVLKYVGEASPASSLAAPDERHALDQWLSFIGSEIHTGIFAPIFDKTTTDGAKEFALSRVPSRFERLSRHLEGREYLLEDFSVADAYLVTILNWCQATPITLGDWPVLAAYHRRLSQRPSVAKAMAEELSLYLEQQKRDSAA